MVRLDPRLIRMLARHFPDLQGLRLIAVSVLLQAVAHVWLATHSELWTIVGGVPVFVLYLGLLGVVDRYYARFGRVVPTSPPRWAGPVFIFLVTFFLPMPRYGFPNIVWTLLSPIPLWVAWDCRPYRWHHLITSASMMYVAFGRLADPNAGDLAWMAPRMWVFTSALAITGLLDHRLFVTTMVRTRALATEGS